MVKKKTIVWIIFLAVVVLVSVLVIAFDWNSINSYKMYNTSALHYVKGKVTAIQSESLTRDDTDKTRYLGKQVISVEIKEGDLAGETVTIDNYLTRAHNIKVSMGQTIIVCADMPQNAKPFFTVYNYYRFPAILLILLIFAVIVLLVGAGKGGWSLLGLGFTMVFILFFLLEAIYHGASPVLATAFTVLLTGAVSLLLLNGFSRKTAAAFISTVIGIGCAGLLFVLFCAMLNLSGYNTEAAESLLLIAQSTGLSIRWLLFAGVLVASLGAVMDVAMSIASALFELAEVNPAVQGPQMFHSGIRIGRDMIGTMCSTLILAFTGAELVTMLVLLSYGYQPSQLLSSDYLAIEVAQGVACTISIVLTVPISAAVSSKLYHKDEAGAGQKKGKKNNKKHHNKNINYA